MSTLSLLCASPASESALFRRLAAFVEVRICIVCKLGMASQGKSKLNLLTSVFDLLDWKVPIKCHRISAGI